MSSHHALLVLITVRFCRKKIYNEIERIQKHERKLISFWDYVGWRWKKNFTEKKNIKKMERKRKKIFSFCYGMLIILAKDWLCFIASLVWNEIYWPSKWNREMKLDYCYKLIITNNSFCNLLETLSLANSWLLTFFFFILNLWRFLCFK